MSDVPFYATRMGRTFYERTMPDLVKAVDRLATATADPDRERRVAELAEYAGYLCDATERVVQAAPASDDQDIDSARNYVRAVRRIVNELHRGR